MENSPKSYFLASVIVLRESFAPLDKSFHHVDLHLPLQNEILKQLNELKKAGSKRSEPAFRVLVLFHFLFDCLRPLHRRLLKLMGCN